MTHVYGADERLCLLSTARESIASRLESRRPAWPAAPASLSEPRGAFVSLHASGRLRGCIGRMQAATPLVETVKAMAAAAAFEDPRFQPLAKDELGGVLIEISVLSPFEPCAVDEVVPGEHGVYLTRGLRGGVFLPQVAPEQGWDRDALMHHLCLKAGLPPGAHLAPDAKLYRFTAEVFREEA